MLRWSVLIVGLVAAVAATRAESVEVAGKVDAVTVYRGQALVTRVVALPPKPGLHELVVTGLPEHVVPGSLYAEAGSGVEVRSVRYRIRPSPADVREDVRKLDEQIQATQDELTAVARRLQLGGERKAYLDKLEQFTATTANVELSRGVLNSDTLQQLSAFLLSERSRLVEDELRLTREQRDFQAQLGLLGAQRQVLTADSARTLREAVVFANVTGTGATELRLSYLVNNANWSPSYNIRASGNRQDAVVEYNAAIQQMSGEDWSNVAMTLSTASPSLTARAPRLTPLTIALVPAVPPMAAGQAGGPLEDYAKSKFKLFEVQRATEQTRARSVVIPEGQVAERELGEGRGGGGAVGWVSTEELDRSLNDLAGQIQVLDLVAAGRITPSEAAPAAVEGYSVTYQIAARTTLPSRNDRQLIQIAALPLRGEFYKVAVPVLTSFVYEEAELTNGSALVLLAGPVSTYLDGQFVGQSTVPNVAAGERFTVGFGIDSALRAARELVERKESVQGGNRIVDFTYRLTVENFGAAPVAALRVLDRLPVAKGSDVKVTLGPSTRELHRDVTPNQTDKDRRDGVLRWDVDVPAQAAGPQAQTLEYQFRLEYDRQMTIGNLPATAP